MPKITFEFNLPDEEDDFRSAYNGNTYYSVIFDILQHLRTKLKHGDLKGAEAKAYEALSKQIWDMLRDHDVEAHFS